jgi:hypothetical protein
MFNVNDRVFHIQYGWGEVYDTRPSGVFYVKFDNGFAYGFGTALQSLVSYTEYTLDGFSSEKPIVTWSSIYSEWSYDDSDLKYREFLEQNFEPPVRKCK